MSSRNTILEAIRKANPHPPSNPITAVEGIFFNDKKQQFVDVLTAIGGNAIMDGNMNMVNAYLEKRRLEGKNIVFVNPTEALDLDKKALYDVDIACMYGGIGVAENGSIWVTEKNMGNRMLPFSALELVIIIQEKNLVHHMHEAYDLINITEDGYGVFIAGPSKTADIEQSLVIGAHGPVSFKVFILNN